MAGGGDEKGERKTGELIEVTSKLDVKEWNCIMDPGRK